MEKYYWSDPPGMTAFPVARPGYRIIFAAAFATVIFAVIGFAGFAVAGLVITGCICCFFRDPDRAVPSKPGAVVSPADGKVIFSELVENNPFIEGKCRKISIFMSVLNVHVNRIPHEGRITDIQYYPGKFFTASLDKASEKNEKNAVILETKDGKKICFVQIAGLVARRIICRIQEGDILERGQRFGMICFGSRLDVYLPADVAPEVTPGDKVMAGTSILGYFS